MSNTDSDEYHCSGRSDIESTLPHYSLVDSTIDLTPLDVEENNPRRFNTTRFSANQTQNRATVIGDSNISGPAPLRAFWCVMHHQEGQNLLKGKNL